MALIGSDRRSRGGGGGTGAPGGDVVFQVAVVPPPQAQVDATAKQTADGLQRSMQTQMARVSATMIKEQEKTAKAISAINARQMLSAITLPIKAMKELHQAYEKLIQLSDKSLGIMEKHGLQGTHAFMTLKTTLTEVKDTYDSFILAMATEGHGTLNGLLNLTKDIMREMRLQFNLLPPGVQKLALQSENWNNKRLQADLAEKERLSEKATWERILNGRDGKGGGGKRYSERRGGGGKRDTTTSDLLAEIGALNSASGMRPGDEAGWMNDEDLATISGGALTGATMDEEFSTYAQTLREQLDSHGVTQGGLMELMVFGVDGVEGFQSLMTSDQEYLLEMFGTLQAAGEQMHGALASALGASVIEGGGFKKMLAEQLKAIGLAMTTRSYWHMLEEIAMGWRDSANLNPVGAAAHFKAAAQFGLIGTAVGLGTRAAVGALTSGGGGGSGGNAGSPTTQRGGSLGGSSRGGSDEPQTIQINQFVFPGGEAEAGRRVQQALDAHHAKKGRAN